MTNADANALDLLLTIVSDADLDLLTSGFNPCASSGLPWLGCYALPTKIIFTPVLLMP